MTKYIPIEPQPFMVLSADEWHARAMSGVDPYGIKPFNSGTPDDFAKCCPVIGCTGVVQRDGVWCWEVEERE